MIPEVGQLSECSPSIPICTRILGIADGGFEFLHYHTEKFVGFIPGSRRSPPFLLPPPSNISLGPSPRELL